MVLSLRHAITRLPPHMPRHAALFFATFADDVFYAVYAQRYASVCCCHNVRQRAFERFARSGKRLFIFRRYATTPVRVYGARALLPS